MKKKLTLILGAISGGWLVWVFLMTLPVLADAGPHRAGTIGTAPSLGASCASCHRAHTAQAPELLAQEQPALCYSCHGDTAVGAELNVEGGTEYEAAHVGENPALRGGGFAYALIDTSTNAGHAQNPSADPEDLVKIGTGVIPVLTTRQRATSAHQVDPSVTVTMWGNGPVSDTSDPGQASVSMTCGNCHDPHGNKAYRILRPIPDGAENDDPITSVNIADAGTKVYTTANYWAATDTNQAQFIQKISAWCSTCHTRYMADSFDATNSTGDAIFTYRHLTNVTQAYGPTCVQCHVAHGSNANMARVSGGVNYENAASEMPLPGQDPATVVNNFDDSRLLRLDRRGVCSMCHFR